jgi:TatD DNase family protein
VVTIAYSFHGRDIVPDLIGAVDAVSVSLNAPTAERYAELCEPRLGNHPPARFFEATVDFLARTSEAFEDVTASVVGHALDHDEIGAKEELATSLGCPWFRVR